MERDVLFVSDRTGITAETLGLSLLTQFNGIQFAKHTRRFINTLDKAHVLAEEITRMGAARGSRPIVFSTMIDAEMRQAVAAAPCVFFDLVDTFIAPLEIELHQRSSHTIGRARATLDQSKYNLRMNAVNYALLTDDGLHTQDYSHADVIVTGVSRCGKTPTCLYLALTFGTYAANYPLLDDDLAQPKLPATLEPHRARLYGLTIDPGRLQQIRRERKAEGHYASRKQCEFEVAQAETLFRATGIPYLDTSAMSVEEIATTILHQQGLQYRLS